MSIAARFTVSLALLVPLLVPSGAAADFGFVPGSTEFEVLDAEGNPDNRAGGHPHTVRIGFGLETAEGDQTVTPKSLQFDLPPGIAGDPGAVPACPRAIFEGGNENQAECPAESQVGTIAATVVGGNSEVLPVFNVEPAPGQLAQLGFRLLAKFPLTMQLRRSDYGISMEMDGLFQSLAIVEGVVDLWGVPADRQEGTEILRRPFLTLPTRCDRGPLALAMRARSWIRPEHWVSATATTGIPLAGCGDLAFEPGLSFALTSSVTDSPSGARIEFDMPQNDDPDGRATSQTRQIVAVLPAGVALSPGGAATLRTCSDAAFAAGLEQKADCPPAARVGRVQMLSPALAQTLEGAVYLGEERPGDRFRLLIVATGPGVEAKLVASLRPDPATGRLQLVLVDLPEVPFSRMVTELDGGPRGLLATPLECGPVEAVATFTPYSGTAPVATAGSDRIEVGAGGRDCGQPTPFAPRFVAGSTSRDAGEPTAFSTTLVRSDGEQLPDRFSVTLPPGLSAAVGKVQRCAAAQVAAAACPEASRVGSAVAEIGSGPEPALLSGSAYLTGTYRRSPYGLALVFRSAIGPFDFGTLTVRAALRIDLGRGLVTVETDSLPRVVEGVPVRFRTIGLDLNRPGLLRNPTSCSPASVDAVAVSTGGSPFTSATPFQLDGCDALRFRPAFAMTMSGRRLRAGARPDLQIAIRAPRGKSTNLRRVNLTLPPLLELQTSAVRQLCSRSAAIAAECPPGSRVGTGLASTPLLKQPLKGSIYVVQPSDSGLPDLWTSLDADGLQVSVEGKTAREEGGRISTTLANLPDLPLTAFRMRFGGGKRGLFALTRRPCNGGGPRKIETPVRSEGQNGAYRVSKMPLAVRGCRPDRERSGARIARLPAEAR